MKNSYVFAMLVCASALTMGCIADDTGTEVFGAGVGGAAGEAGAAGSAGEAGNGGSAGTGGAAGEAGNGGSGGSDPECIGDVFEACECPDGTEGTKQCENEQWADCLCFYYPDRDGDKHGDENADPHEADDAPAGFVGNNDDCEDGNASSHPGATEVCDEEDNDCDGEVDEGDVCGTSRTWYKDDDGDGYGNPNKTLIAVHKPSGYVPDNTDCDDSNKNVNPGAVEICGNGIDDDCDGQTDENCEEPKTYYRDSDGDGYGGLAQSVTSMTQPQGYVLDHSDCDDGNDGIHPGATEVCNNIDDDCDGNVDEGLNCDGPDTYFRDQDSDGYGDPAQSVTSNNQPAGYVTNHDDCDDGSNGVHPGATEVCNNIDDDCDGNVDEGLNCGGEYTYYRDNDGDGYTTSETMTSSSSTPPSGWRASQSDPLDCNDDNQNVNPGEVEVCGNNIDDDCDGYTDEGCQTGCTDGATQSCTCTGGTTGTQTCSGGDWTACACGGSTTIKFEVDCSSLPWALNPVPQGSYAGRDYGDFTNCTKTASGVVSCTFDMPAPDFPSFIGQGHAGYGKYAGDGSGNSPAPCYTPAEVDAMQGTTITLMCSVRLWKDGVPQQLRWETNSVMVQDSTQSCSESGYFPYYNAVPAL